MLVTTTVTVFSAEAVVCPFSVILYLTVYTPAGAFAFTFTFPESVSILTFGLVTVGVIVTKSVVSPVRAPSLSLVSIFTGLVPSVTKVSTAGCSILCVEKSSSSGVMVFPATFTVMVAVLQVFAAPGALSHTL